MPISLIRNTKDNAMHGSDNDRYTGCRMKMQGGSWYTKEGELKDITDLTCDRCKEVFATKMIRESNKEELRIAKEEKKRYQRAKKQGIVREATYEEYMMNREAEASSKRDSRDDEATSQSLQMLRDAIPAEQPVQPSFNSYNPSVNAPQSQFNPYTNSTPAAVPQSPFDPYAQQTPVVNAPQAAFNPYAQPAPAVSAPQAPFDPYAQQSPVVSAPQAPFDPYAMASQPQMFNPYAQSSVSGAVPQGGSLQFDSFASSAPQAQTPAPADVSPAPSYQEYTGAASVNTAASQPSGSSSQAAAEDDDFLSQFMFKPAASPEAEKTVSAPASSVTADSIVNATDDILSQFNIGSQMAASAPSPAPTPAPAASSAPKPAKADASSFFSDNIPVIGAEYAGASSVNSVVTEFGSLNIAEDPKDEFVVPDVPVYQPGGNSYVNPPYKASQSSVSLSELVSPDTSSLPKAQPESFNDAAAGFGDDLMSGFGDLSSVSTVDSFDAVKPVQPSVSMMDGFDTVAPVQPTAPVMSGFDTVAPVQPTAPVMGGFDTAAPVQPAAPVMGGFDTVAPVQPAAQVMGGFDTVAPVQPAAPVMGGFDTAAPVQPVAPVMGGFDTIAPVQPAAPAMNGFGSVSSVQNPYAAPQNYSQPASYQQPVSNPYTAPVQNSGFQMPQGFGTPAAQTSSIPLSKQTPQAPVFASQSGTADSIEEALRQLGADTSGMGGNNNNQMPDKEEITPDFVSYVPSSSKVLHTSAPSQSASSSVPKRPVSAREAKQLAKIDAKFKKDLMSRGFNANEIKNGRRGK